MPGELVFLFVLKKDQIGRKSPPFFHLWHVPVAQGIFRSLLRVSAAACPVTSQEFGVLNKSLAQTEISHR